MGKKRKRSRDKSLRKENKRLKEMLRSRRRLNSSSSSVSGCSRVSRDLHETQEFPAIGERGAEMDRSTNVISPMHADEVIDTEFINDMDGQVEEGKETEADLDPEILQILGDDPSNENKFGEDLHRLIMPRWKHILAKGLDKEVKTELCKQYLPPENCGNLRAPKLNPQVRRFLSEINKKKEMFNENKQNQLSSCLAALGKALNIALSIKGNAVPQDIIKSLSDAGRLLCDFHYRESQSRRYAIINVINKDMRETLKNTIIDEFLFGADLTEQLKQDKEISRVAMDLRNPRTPLRPPATAQAQRGTLNLRGARGSASAPRQYPSQQRQSTSTGAGAATTSRGRDRRRYDSSNWRGPSGSSRGRTARR